MTNLDCGNIVCSPITYTQTVSDPVMDAKVEMHSNTYTYTHKEKGENALINTHTHTHTHTQRRE